MMRDLLPLIACAVLAGCNANTDGPTAHVASAGPRAAGQPTQAQIFARDEWIACLQTQRRAAAASGPTRAADIALQRCRRQENTLAARLAEDPSLTPVTARAGLEKIKDEWRRAT